MQLLKTKSADFHVSIKGYHERTPLILKYIADFIQYPFMLAGDGIIAGLPEFEHKVWWVFGWTTLCSLFKLVTKFITEFPKPPILD
jgi:hypothetical protein